MKGTHTNFALTMQPSRKENADHVKLRQEKQPMRTVIHNADITFNFTNWERTQRCHFVAYADLEALFVPTSIKGGNKTVTWKTTRQVRCYFSRQSKNSDCVNF